MPRFEGTGEMDRERTRPHCDGDEMRGRQQLGVVGVVENASLPRTRVCRERESAENASLPRTRVCQERESAESTSQLLCTKSQRSILKRSLFAISESSAPRQLYVVIFEGHEMCILEGVASVQRGCTDARGRAMEESYIL